MELIYHENQSLKLPNGDSLLHRGHGLILSFSGVRHVFHTSVAGGGIHYDLNALFNFDLKDENGRCEMRELNYKDELNRIARELDLSPQTSVGMTTAVSMDEAVIEVNKKDGLWVAAIVTGGIENNAGYPGDAASYREENDGFVIIGGTINTIVMIGADLPDGILCRAAVTATEAKCAAIRELRLPSIVSGEIATGSGTDGLAVVCDPNSPLKRTDAGKHSLLGELIGDTVRTATKKALLRHMKTEHTDMTRMSNRLKRFGITFDGFQQYAVEHDVITDAARLWREADENPLWAGRASMAAAIMDDVRHGIFTEAQGMEILRQNFHKHSNAESFPQLWYEIVMTV